MNVKSGKGYALALAIIFIVIVLVASVGFYLSVTYLGTETQVKEVGYTKGYYAGIAGVRYAIIRLRQNPASLFTTTAHNGEEITLDSANDPYYPTFVNDIEVDTNDFSIRIKEYDSNAPEREDHPDWEDGEYLIEATYVY